MKSGSGTINILSDLCQARQVGLKYKMHSVAGRGNSTFGLFKVVKPSSSTLEKGVQSVSILAVQSSRLNGRNCGIGNEAYLVYS